MPSFNEYLEWLIEYDKSPKTEKFGQAFCNKFGVTDEELFYCESRYRCSCIIADKNYVELES